MKTFIFTLIVAFIFAGCSKDKTSTGEITTASGLKYTDLVVGKGLSPVPGQKVQIHYTGWTLDGKKFDSSKDRNKPYEFIVGSGTTVLGWEEGVLTMHEGGKRKLIVPPQLAYGERGVQGVIPPNSTVIFEIELLLVTNP